MCGAPLRAPRVSDHHRAGQERGSTGISAALGRQPPGVRGMHMKLTLVVAIAGVTLALIDFFGMAQHGERAIRRLVGWILSGGNWLTSTLYYVGWAALIAMVAIVAVMFVTHMSGVNPALVMRLDDIQYGFFRIGMSLLALSILVSILAMLTYAAFWVLSLPKRGIMSTLGLAIAVIGVVLEVL